MTDYDIIIIGGGMAGASLGAEVAAHARVLILEMEDVAGYHATGRSAAFWSETYGGPLVQPLTTASGAFLRCPPADFHDAPFLKPRGAVHLADAEGGEALQALGDDFPPHRSLLEPMDSAALGELIPGLRA